MANRVTFSQINDRVQTNITANYGKMADLQEQLSSGKRVKKPSDDPIAINNDLQLRSEIVELEQYKRNIDDGSAYLAIIGDVSSNTNDLFQRARELALQASNDVNTAKERGFINQEIRVLLDQIAAISNNTYKGSFLFSGTNTREQPYEMKTGFDVIDVVDQTAMDNTDTFVDPLAPMPQTIQIWDRSVRDSTIILPNPNGNAETYDIIPGTLEISGLEEGTDYSVDYVNGTITFMASPTTFIPGINGGAGANLTQAQILASDPINVPGWPPSGDPSWPAGSAQPQPSGGLRLDYEWIRRNEADMDGAIVREIEEGLKGKINVTATEMFGSKNELSTWDAMVKLMEGLHLNNSLAIRESIDGITVAMDRTLQAQAHAGANTNRFESTEARNTNYHIETTRLQSEIEDVDFAKAISEFIMAESVHTASLQAGARVLQPTLANFI